MIPVGGGGLLAGVAVAVKGLRPDVQIIVRENYYFFRVSFYFFYYFTGSLNLRID